MKRKPSRKFESRRGRQKAISGLAAIFFLAALTFAAPYLSAGKNKKDKSAESSKATKALPIQDLTEDEAILQALNRLGFGIDRCALQGRRNPPPLQGGTCTRTHSRGVAPG